MYMPASIQVSYATKYNDEAISGLAKASNWCIYQNVKGGQSFGDAFKEQLPSLAEDNKKKGLKVALDIADGLGVTGAREAMKLHQVKLSQIEWNLHLKM